MSWLSVIETDYPLTFKCPQLENSTNLFSSFTFPSDVLGWGVFDATGEQSRYLRQVYLTVNTSITDCGCTDDYLIQTNVGPRGQDPCAGDSGRMLTAVFFW